MEKCNIGNKVNSRLLAMYAVIWMQDLWGDTLSNLYNV